MVCFSLDRLLLKYSGQWRKVVIPELSQHKFIAAFFTADGIAFFLAFDMLGLFASGAFSVIAEDR